MPELARDRHARRLVDAPLRRPERPPPGAARDRRLPARQGLVAGLRIGVALIPNSE